MTGRILDGGLRAIAGEELRNNSIAVGKHIFVGEIYDIHDIAALVVEVEFY